MGGAYEQLGGWVGQLMGGAYEQVGGWVGQLMGGGVLFNKRHEVMPPPSPRATPSR